VCVRCVQALGAHCTGELLFGQSASTSGASDDSHLLRLSDVNVNEGNGVDATRPEGARRLISAAVRPASATTVLRMDVARGVLRKVQCTWFKRSPGRGATDQSLPEHLNNWGITRRQQAEPGATAILPLPACLLLCGCAFPCLPACLLISASHGSTMLQGHQLISAVDLAAAPQPGRSLRFPV
jgi:hypothetical protein